MAIGEKVLHFQNKGSDLTTDPRLGTISKMRVSGSVLRRAAHKAPSSRPKRVGS